MPDTNYLNTANPGAAGDVSYEAQDYALARGLGRLRGALLAGRLVTNYSAEAKDQGSRFAENVRVPIRGAAALQDKTPGTTITPVQFTDTKADLALDQHKIWDVIIEDYGSLFTGPQKALGHLSDAAGQIAEAVDSAILALYTGAGRVFGSTGTAATPSLIRSVRKQAVKDKWGTAQPRNIIWGPEGTDDLLSDSTFTKVNEAGGDDALVNGNVGRKYGFNHYEHEGVASIAGSPGAEHALAFQGEGIGLAFMDMDISDFPDDFKQTVMQRAMALTDDSGLPLYQMRMIVGYDQGEVGMRFQVDSIFGVKIIRSTLVYDLLIG